MRIGILTCLRVYNAGAALQAYALAEQVRRLGHDPVVVDYRPEYLYGEYRPLSVPHPYFRRNAILRAAYLLAKAPTKAGFLLRKRAFDRFIDRRIPVTPRAYRSSDDLATLNGSLDAFIAGSDQIWNMGLPNGRDPAFYLGFAAEDKPRISYAASFGTLSIPADMEAGMLARIARLRSVSVRERRAVAYLAEHGIEARHACDPALLLSRDDWAEACDADGGRRGRERYVLGYDFDDGELTQRLLRRLSSRGRVRIHSMLPSRHGERSFYHQPPMELVRQVRDAEAVVTSSYHGVLFSLLFHRDFYVVRRREDLNLRIQDLLETLGLEDRIVDDVERLPAPRIDHDRVDAVLDRLARASKDFLREALDHGA